MDQKIIDEIAKAAGTSPSHVTQLISDLAASNHMEPDAIVSKLYDEYMRTPHNLSRKDTIQSMVKRMGMAPEEVEKLMNDVDALLKKPS